MSIPQNPLDKYASFSTHYVLLLARSTEAIRYFTERESSRGQNANLNELNRLRLGEKLIGDGSKNQVYMICDSRKISLFRIDSVNFQTLFSGRSAATSQVISGNIEMKLMDASGIAFMNFLKYMADEVLDCSLVNCIFLLKIFFVGHTHDQTTEVLNTSSIPLMLQELSFQFETQSSIGAAQYDIKFMPSFAAGQSVNEFVPSDRISSIVAKGPQATLGSAIDSLQNALNKISAEHYDSTQYQYLNETTQKNEPSLSKNKKGRIILYKITLPGDIPGVESSTKWRDLPYTAGVSEKIEEISHEKNKKEKEENKNQKKAESKEGQESDTEKDNDATYKAVPRNMTMTEIITSILNSCLDVNRKASFKSIEEGKIVSFKIITNVTTDDESMVINFDVVEHIFIDPNQKKDEAKKNTSTEKDAKAVGVHDAYFTKNEKGESIPKNSLEYDYVFSGKNTDIIDFQVKIDASASLFSVLNKTKSTPDQITRNDIGQSSTADGSKSTDNAKNVSMREMKTYDVVAIPPKTSNEKTGYSNLIEGTEQKTGIPGSELSKIKQEYLKVLADIHGQSSLNTKMKIRGNPDLFVKILGNTILPHQSFVPGSLSSNKQVTFLENSTKEYNTALAKRLNAESPKNENSLMSGSDPSVSPLYVKVNIYGPKIDPVFGEQMMPGSEKFTQQYFYEGWYLVNKITHSLAGNDFSQEIDMGAIEPFKSSLITSEGSK